MNNGIEIGEDLQITKVDKRSNVGGTWVCGSLNGHRFEALVFPEHAAEAGYEIEDSRVSKLWVQRLSDKTVVYEWDRGLSKAAADPTAANIVGFLSAGLAEHTFGK